MSLKHVIIHCRDLFDYLTRQEILQMNLCNVNTLH